MADVSLSNAGNAIIRAAARIDEQTALCAIGTTEEITATLEGGKVRGRKVLRAGAIELSSTPVKVTGAAAEEALAAGIREHGLAMFSFSEKAQNLRERLAHLHAHYGAPWPDVDNAEPAEWLGPELHDVAAGKPATKVDMYPALQRLLPGRKPRAWMSWHLNACPCLGARRENRLVRGSPHGEHQVAGMLWAGGVPGLLRAACSSTCFPQRAAHWP